MINSTCESLITCIGELNEVRRCQFSCSLKQAYANSDFLPIQNSMLLDFGSAIGNFFSGSLDTFTVKVTLNYTHHYLPESYT